MSDFCDATIGAEFDKAGKVPEGGPGKYDGDMTGPFGEYKRTPSPNAVKEKLIDGGVVIPSGESDQF